MPISASEPIKLPSPSPPVDSPAPRRSKRRRGMDPDEDSSEVEIVEGPPKSTDKVQVGPVRISFIILKLLLLTLFVKIARKAASPYRQTGFG